MAVKIITSSTTNFSSEFCVAEIAKQSLTSGFQKFVVITPENFTLKIEEAIASHHENSAFANIEITNFSRLFKRLKKNNTPVLSNEMEVMAIRKIVFENQNQLKCFAKSSDKAGFANEMHQTITKMKQSGIKSQDKPELKNNSLGSKLHDVFLIYEKYEQFLKTGFFDQTDRLDILQNIVENENYFSGKKVFLLGFDSMTKKGYDLVCQIVKKSIETTIACSKTKNEESNEFFNKIVQILQNNQIFFEKIFVEPQNEAKQIADFFGFEKCEAFETEKIKLFESNSIQDEVEKVASEIAHEIKNGKRFKDLEVACSSLELYKNSIQKIFNDFNLPCFFDKSANISNHPFVTQLLLALKIAQKNFPQTEVLSFVKNPFFEVEPQNQMIFENYVKEFGCDHSDFSSEFVFGKTIEKENEFYQTAELVRKKIFESISCLMFSSKTTVKLIIEKLMNFCTDERSEQKLQYFAEKQSKFDIFESKVTQQVKNKVDELLVSLEKILGEQIVSLEEFISIFQSGLNSIGVNVVPIQIDRIYVSDISQSRHDICKSLYILGASESFLPVTKKDCGILTDEEIKEIAGVIEEKLEPTVKTLNKRERQTIFELICNPTEKLCVSFSKYVNGEEQKISFLQRMLTKLFKTSGQPLCVMNDEKVSKVQIQESNFKKLANLKQCEKVLFENVRKKKRNISSKGMFDFSNALYFAVSNQMSEKNKKLLEPFVEEENIKNSNKLFFEADKTSVSEIESYFCCPYKHFVDYGLRAKQNEEAKMKAMDIGSLLHEVLEKLTKELIKNPNFDTESDELNEKIKEILAEVVLNEKYQSEVNNFMLQTLKNEACRLCYAIIVGNQKSEFKPIEAEMKFGKGQKVGEIEFEKTNVVLEGKIDRVDKWKNFVRLVDYKTGKIDLSCDEIYHGKKIQLFAYMLAFESNKNENTIGVFYLPIKNTFSKNESNIFETYKMQGYFCDDPEIIFAMDKTISLTNPQSNLINVSLSSSKENILLGKLALKPQKHIVSIEKLKKISKYVKGITENAIVEIQEGNICPSPLEDGNSSTCDYCQMRSVCGIEQNKKRRRKQFGAMSVDQIVGVKND